MISQNSKIRMDHKESVSHEIHTNITAQLYQAVLERKIFNTRYAETMLSLEF